MSKRHGNKSKKKPGDEAPAPPTIKCPHCGARFAKSEIDRTSGAPACPRCHLFLQDEVHLA